MQEDDQATFATEVLDEQSEEGVDDESSEKVVARVSDVRTAREGRE